LNGGDNMKVIVKTTGELNVEKLVENLLKIKKIRYGYKEPQK
jgi:hypothetical protein